jgi:hypothetical protein
MECYYSKVERLTKDKQSSLLGPLVRYDENEVLRQGMLTEGEVSVQLTSSLFCEHVHKIIS